MKRVGGSRGDRGRARYVCAVVGLAMVVAARAAVALTQIDFISDPGDFIGGGKTFSLTPADGTFTAKFSNGALSIQYFGLPPAPSSSFWFLHLAPVFGTGLAPGHYASTQRWPFQSPKHPGLDISGEGRGCNTSSGVFTVFEATFDASGNVVAFAADAEQHCGGTADALRAHIRINSGVPLLMPFPQGIAGLPQEIYERTLVTLDGSQSYEPAGVIVSWIWSQLSGPPVLIESPDAAVTSFRAPDVGPGGADVRFKLDVQDGRGIHATDTVDVHVFDRHDRRSWLTWRSPEGDYIGQGRPLAFSAADGDTKISSTPSSASLTFAGADYWFLDFAAPNSTDLVPGPYLNAERFPFQTTGHPGMDIAGAGRGCNMLSGEFTVLEVDRTALPQRFGARFVQSCEGFMPPLRGTVLFNSIAPGNPAARVAGPSFAVPGAAVNLDGAGSSSTGSALVSYRWRQLSGPPVATTDPTLPKLDFVMPGTAASALRFELEVADEDGLIDVAEASVASAPAPANVPTLGVNALAMLAALISVFALMTRRDARWASRRHRGKS